MNRTARYILIIMGFSVVLGNAYASVISDFSLMDWKTSGDKLLIYDSSTRLRWLKLTQTTGMSIRDIEDGSLISEFYWATEEDVNNILQAAIPGDGSRHSTNQSRVADTSAFITMFGPTVSFLNVVATQGVRRDNLSFAEHPVDFALIKSGTTARVYGQGWYCCRNDYTKTDDVGAWLIMRADVTEPGAFTLMGIGLLGLFGTRHRGKRNPEPSTPHHTSTASV